MKINENAIVKSALLVIPLVGGMVSGFHLGWVAFLSVYAFLFYLIMRLYETEKTQDDKAEKEILEQLIATNVQFKKLQRALLKGDLVYSEMLVESPGVKSTLS